MSAYIVTACAVCGEAPRAGAWALFGLATLACSRFARRLGPSRGAILGLGALLTSSALGAITLPPGSPRATVYFLCVITVFTMVSTLRRACLAYAALTLLTAGCMFGLPPAHAFAPEHWFTAPLLLLGCACVIAQTTSARERNDKLAASILASEREALDAEARVNRQRVELVDNMAEHGMQNDRLLSQVAREAKLTADLVRQHDEQRDLVHAIHHDLREPLRNIVSFTQLIRRRLSEEPEAARVMDYLGFAEDGGRRMAVMLADLLSYTHDDPDERPRRLELDDVLAQVADNVRALLASAGAQLQVSSLPAVYGHQTQLIQLFQNLVSNSIKFTSADRAPRVSISQRLSSDGALVIAVEDNGIGIPADRLDSVFGLFNRAHADASYEGSGVGLALCRRIATAHEAEISVESEVGRGTCFSIAFAEYAPVAFTEEVAAPIKANHA